jgi:enolase
VNIKELFATEILDSRGNPTIEVTMELSNGVKCTASIPSGASTGSKEALELRDQDLNRYNGKGVLKAVENVNTTIHNALIGRQADLLDVDNTMLRLDGTENKSKLGANAMLGVSLACLKCLAKSNNKEIYEYISSGSVGMPIPMVNIINGGVHADSGLSIQEFMIVPVVKQERERIRVSAEIYHTLKKVLKKHNLTTAVGDEGGYAPKLNNTKEALDLIIEAIEESGYTPGKQVFIALDAAASEFYDENTQKYTIDNQELNADELIKYYLNLVKIYPIISLEDPFWEHDFESFAVLTKLIGKKVMLVGDDYFVTNIKYLEEGHTKEAGNAILLKANQIGTISEMTKTIMYAKKIGYKCVISHRSGETLDTFIADFAVGFPTEFIKTGSICRGERIAKYNRLMEIENNLTKK